MKVFCVNINNTNTHYGVVTEDLLIEGASVPTRTLGDPRLGMAPIIERVAQRHPETTGLCYGSVVPQATDHLRRIIAESGWRRTVHQLTWDNCPVPLHFPNPIEIGQDRLANAVAALELYGAPSIVIDFGTAVTFDIVSSNGYEGGIIAPGLEIMTRYLHEETALLPKLDPDDLAASAGIGKSTVEAMKLGCAVGMHGMIRALLQRLKSSLKEIDQAEAAIIATGGSAGVLPETWFADIEFDPHITIIGLALAFAKYHQKGSSGSLTNEPLECGG